MFHSADVNIRKVLLDQEAANKRQVRKELLDKRLKKVYNSPPPPGIHSKRNEFEKRQDVDDSKPRNMLIPRGQGTNEGF